MSVKSGGMLPHQRLVEKIGMEARGVVRKFFHVSCLLLLGVLPAEAAEGAFDLGIRLENARQPC